jgi:peroxiredoxin
VAISADSPADSQALRERLGLEFPLLHDDGAAVAAGYQVAMRNQNIAVPSVFIVMPDRTIAWKYIGENAGDRPPEDQVLEQLDALANTNPAVSD